MKSFNVAEVLEHLVDADYVYESDKVEANEEADRLIELADEVRQAALRLDFAWAAAFLAGMFVERPWLQGFNLSLTRTHEHSDEGGTYTSYSVSLSGVRFVQGQELPEDLQDEGLDAADAVESDLKEQCSDWEIDLCEPFLGPTGEDELDLTLDRTALAGLLATEPISGLAVARRLWPEDMKRLG